MTERDPQPLTQAIDALVDAIAGLTPAPAESLTAFRVALSGVLEITLGSAASMAAEAVVSLYDRVKLIERWTAQHDERHARDTEALVARLGGAVQVQALVKRMDELESRLKALE